MLPYSLTSVPVSLILTGYLYTIYLPLFFTKSTPSSRPGHCRKGESSWQSRRTDDIQRSPDHIDQIRDIIMGPQKREMDQRHDRLSADLRRHQEDTGTRVEEFRALITAESGRLLKTMQQNREKLEGCARGQGTRTRFGPGRPSPGTRCAQGRNSRHDLRATRDQLAGELEKNITALRDSSVARESLAEFFQELALKLRKDDVLEEFRNAVRSGEGA